MKRPPACPFVLGVDLGTSGPKAAVVSLEGRICATAQAAVPTLHLPDGGAEQDPEVVWRAVEAACAAAMRRSGVPPKDVLAVACSSQYSSIVPVDTHGRPTANMLLWLDRRGATQRLRGLPGFPRGADSPLQLLRWLHRHGLPPVAGGISLTHMRYLRFARPEVYGRTAKFLEPMDYVLMRLTGRATANQCTAFMSLLTDNRRLDATGYDPVLLRQSLVDADKLPELVPLDAIVGTVLPEVAAGLGLAPGTRVVTGLNDTQAGGMGTAAFAGSHAAMSVGSTSTIITHVPRKRTDVRHAILSMPSPVPGRYFVMAENGVAGGALQHFLDHLVYARDGFGSLDDSSRYASLQRAVEETPPGAAGVLFLPWLGGTLSPAPDSLVRGGFLNLGLSVTRSHLARAVLEGVALNFRWLRGPVEKFAGRAFSHIKYYGGGAGSDAWSQILADVLGTPVHQLEDPQFVTCRGMALLAFQRLGLLAFEDFEGRIPVRRVYEPNRAHERLYDARFEQFVAAFRRNRPVFRALNRPGPAP
jgi:xylulokinase